MVGQRIGRFTIVSKLGEGGMGAVWKAEDTVLGRMVALKFLPDHLVDSPRARERFLREARATSALDDPRIAAVYETGEHEGRQFIAQAFVDGITLHDSMASGPPPLPEVVRIVADVAEALEHAHARGVIHRDITSRNIMLARDGRVVVIDFGLAARFDTPRITTSGTTIGTLGYTAPEVLGGKHADRRSDIYSLGVVLYELATGVPPHRYQIPAAQIFATMQETPESPSSIRPEISRGLDRLMLKALSKDPDRRPQSALEFARALRASRQGPPAKPRARGPSVGPRRPSTTRRASRLVVLPFRGSASGSQPDALPLGLAEALRAQLSRVPGVQVLAPHAPTATSEADDPVELGRALRAALVLSGSIHTVGDRLRVTYSIIETRGGTQLAGDHIDGAIGDLFAIEDAVLASVLRGLRAGTAERALLRAPEPRPADYRQYLEALGHMYRTDSDAEVDRAIGLLEDLDTRQGKTAAVQAQLGKAYFRKYEMTLDLGWKARAEAANRLALGLDPNSNDVLLTSVRIDLLNGRFEHAISTLQPYLVASPHDVPAWSLLARVYRLQGRFGAAEEAARRAIQIDPADWRGHEQLGHICFLAGRYEDAIVSWRKVIDLVPDHAVAHAGLGAVYFGAGRLDDSAAAYERAIEIHPSASAYYGLGTVYFYQGNTERSLDAFERSVELRPRDPRAWANLADTQRWVTGLERQSEEAFDRAIALMRDQLETNPNDGERWAYLASWLSKRGCHAEALEDLRRAFELAPANVNVLARAITVHHLAGRRAEAMAALERAVEAGYSIVELRKDPELEELRQDAAGRELLGAASGRRSTSSAADHENRSGRMPSPKNVNVTLSGGRVSVDVDPVVVKWKLNEEAVWHCVDGTLDIVFKTNGNPFAGNPPRHKHPHSGLAQNRQRRRYKYTVTVNPDDGSPSVTLDPQVAIDDSGPPGGGHGKKRAKKAAKKRAKKRVVKRAVRRRVKVAKQRVVKRAVRRRVAKKRVVKRVVRRVRAAKKRVARRVVRKRIARKRAARKR